MSEISYTIHTGRWTDWSRGPVIRDQVTLSSQDGQILIGFIAIFVTFVGSQSWSITSFVLHQIRSDRMPRIQPQRELQILLRNSDSQLSFSKLALYTAWKHRKLNRSAAFWGFFLGSLSALMFALFSIAGLLLTLIARRGNVLMIPTHCIDGVSRSLDARVNSNIGSVVGKKFQQVSTYASNCYPIPANLQPGRKGQRLPVIACKKFVSPNLPWNFRTNVSCPFSSQWCRSDEPVIHFETGKINSNDVLGINTAPENQVEVKYTATCAALNDSQLKITEDGYTTWNVGPNEWDPSLKFSIPANLTQVDLELQQHNIGGDYAPIFNTFPTQVRTENKGNRTATFMFLSNRAIFQYHPVQGFWFGAQTRIPSSGHPIFRSSVDGQVAGCVQRTFYCNPARKNMCVAYVPTWEHHDYIRFYSFKAFLNSKTLKPLGLNHEQLSVLSRYFTMPMTISTPLEREGAAILDINQQQFGVGYYLGVPADQWQFELSRLFSISLAQQQILAFEANLYYPDDLKKVPVNQGNTSSLCNSMKIHDSSFISFPVLWLGLIFGLGGSVIIASVVIEYILPYVQGRFSEKCRLAQENWNADSILQLVPRSDETSGDAVSIKDEQQNDMSGGSSSERSVLDEECVSPRSALLDDTESQGSNSTGDMQRCSTDVSSEDVSEQTRFEVFHHIQ